MRGKKSSFGTTGHTDAFICKKERVLGSLLAVAGPSHARTPRVFQAPLTIGGAVARISADLRIR